MEIIPLLKYLADMGLTAPAIIGVALLWKINKSFACHDKRISILESHFHRRKDD